MKSTLTGLLFSFLTFSQAQFTVIPLPDFPGYERDDAVAVYCNGSIYGGFGLSSGFFPLNDWWAYELSTQQWTQLLNAPFTPRQYVRTFTIDNNIYLFGGWQNDQEFYNELWRFSTADTSWQQMTSLPAAPRWGGMAFSIGGKGYVGLGRDTANSFKDFWQYDPTADKWQRLTDFPGISRSNGFGVSVNQRGVVGFGLHLDNGQFSTLNDIWQYHPVTDQWQLLYTDSSTYSYVAAAALADKLYFQGSFDLPNILDSNFRSFALQDQQFIDYGFMSLPQTRGGSMVAAQGSLYILWGLNNQFQRLNSFYRIDIDENSSNSFSLFPNPITDGSCIVTFPTGQRSYQVINTSGQMLTKGNIDPEEESLLLHLSLKDGLYLLVLEDNKGGLKVLKFLNKS